VVVNAARDYRAAVAGVIAGTVDDAGYAHAEMMLDAALDAMVP
jgi:hypothetical protein